MASAREQADAALSALSSVATCTPTTTVILKGLLLSAQQPNHSSKDSAAETKATKSRTSRTARANRIAALKPNSKETKTGGEEREQLSAKEKAALASQIINLALKSLGDASKQSQSSSPGRQAAAGEPARTAARNNLRRSNSAPLVPLEPRTLNRVSTSPIARSKTSRSPTSLSSSTGCLSTVECVKMAFSVLSKLQSSGAVSLPELQLEAGISSFVSKLLGLGLMEQASKELSSLKCRLQRLEGKEPKTPARQSTTSSAPASSQILADVLDFRECQASGAALSLIITTQLQALRILSQLKKPAYTEAALPFLRVDVKSAPLNMLLRLADESAEAKAKSSRQLETLAQLLLSLTPSVSPKEDDVANEGRLSISPRCALELQSLGLLTRLHFWRLSRQNGDVDKDIISPLSRCISAYVRRHQKQPTSLYQPCLTAFTMVYGKVEDSELRPSLSSKSYLAAIYQVLATLSRETGLLDAAIGWCTKLKDTLDPAQDTAARFCSLKAQLLSLHFKQPQSYLQDNDLLSELVEGIQGPLKGDTAELDDLLTNVLLVRRQVMLVWINQARPDCNPADLVSPDTKKLLETFILQFPKFCVRWLGKPPTTKNNSPKDFLRYDQRRQQLINPVNQILDSSLMIIKAYIDGKIALHDAHESSLRECGILLEYLGDLPISDPSSSPYVKLSWFYHRHHIELSHESSEGNDGRAWRALQHSIDCLKNRPIKEKEHGRFIVKLERLAELSKSSGRINEAIGPLQAARTSLVDHGVLQFVAKMAAAEPLSVVWTASDEARSLSRVLCSLDKLVPFWLDWTTELSEVERVAALEHRLHFILLKVAKHRRSLKTSNSCVRELLRICGPNKFPIRRLRSLTALLAGNIDDPEEVLAIEAEADGLLGRLKKSELGEDVALAPYLQHFQTLYASMLGLINPGPSTSSISQPLSVWRSIVETCTTSEDLRKSIDNASVLLDHLNSVADFSRMHGEDNCVTEALELSTKISSLMASSCCLEDILNSHTSLAMQYINIGYTTKAGKVLEEAQQQAQQCRPDDAVEEEVLAALDLHLSEHLISVGELAKAENHLSQAETLAEAALAGSRSWRPRRKALVSHASYLRSILSLERGDASHALLQARNSVRWLYQDWLKLEKEATTPQQDQNVESGEKTSVEGNSSLSVSCIDSKNPVPEMVVGPAFWRLLHPLFRSIHRLAMVHAHLGMYSETMYYAEQARKIASSANSRIYMAQCEAWIASMSLKAGKIEDAARLATEARSRLRSDDKTVLTVKLSCLMAKLYGQLEDVEAEAEMLSMAQAALQSLTGDSGHSTSDMIELEQEMAELVIKNKPTRPARKTRVAAPVKPRATKVSSTKSKPAAVPEPAPVVEELGLSKLKLSVLIQQAFALLGTKDWSATKQVLGEARKMVGYSGGYPLERMMMASCLVGESLEQMAQDAVFSVIQESTLSFPSVSNGISDRLSPSKSQALKAGAINAAPQERSKSTDKRALVFLENLHEARQCLVEAQAIAAMTGDGSTVHKIAAMLQSTAILLTATCSATRPRLMGQAEYASFSVDVGRNLTWWRERKAMLLETTSAKSDGLGWPQAPAQQGSRRSSLSPVIDLGRFQRDYVDIIPTAWNVISMSLSDNGHDLCIARVQPGQSPFVIRLPLERASSRDADSEVFNFYQGRTEMLEIIKLVNASCHDKRDWTVKGAKTAWWAEREELDTRLRDLLVNIENVWLGGFKGIFSPHRRQIDLLARFQASFHNVLDKYLPSRQPGRGKKKAKATSPPKITLDPRILELFIGLGDATTPNVDFDEVLNDLLYFVVDILQFNGERNAYDEIDFDSMVVETFDALYAYHSAVNASTEPLQTAHTILVLDKSLHTFPWESMPCLQGQALSRVPSFACLRRLIQERLLADMAPTDGSGELPKHQSGHKASALSGAYILNPGTDLTATQEAFEVPLARLLPSESWMPIVSRAPTEDEFERALAERDVLLYFGHGSGSQYIRGRAVRRLPRCRAAVLLMGCSSASLADNAEFELSGPVWNYMMAGAPAVVGTLWDVTDRDIDRYAGRVFEEWGLVGRGAFAAQDNNNTGKKKKTPGEGEKKKAEVETGRGSGVDGGGDGAASLAEAVARARSACRFRYITAAAVCVYGIPVYLDKEAKLDG